MMEWKPIKRPAQGPGTGDRMIEERGIIWNSFVLLVILVFAIPVTLVHIGLGLTTRALCWAFFELTGDDLYEANKE